MDVDGKWDSVTAAIAAFVEDPRAAGIGMGMQFFPIGTSCSDTVYATPAAPIQLLPSNAAAIKASLAAHTPDGNTPTVPALRGAIEYARASMIGDPTREVLVVLATDGDPDVCSSDVPDVAAVAADGLSTHPQVLTAVIGIENADATALAVMAAAGGGRAADPHRHRHGRRPAVRRRPAQDPRHRGELSLRGPRDPRRDPRGHRP